MAFYCLVVLSRVYVFALPANPAAFELSFQVNIISASGYSHISYYFYPARAGSQIKQPQGKCSGERGFR